MPSQGRYDSCGGFFVFLPQEISTADFHELFVRHCSNVLSAENSSTGKRVNRNVAIPLARETGLFVGRQPDFLRLLIHDGPSIDFNGLSIRAAAPIGKRGNKLRFHAHACFSA